MGAPAALASPRISRMLPSPLTVASRDLLVRDLLSPATPYSPITPSSSTAFALYRSSPKDDSNGPSAEFKLSAPPTPVALSSPATAAGSDSHQASSSNVTAGTGMVVKLSDGRLAVKTTSKLLRIANDGDDGQQNKYGAGGKPLVEGEEVSFSSDGSRAFRVERV